MFGKLHKLLNNSPVKRLIAFKMKVFVYIAHIMYVYFVHLFCIYEYTHIHVYILEKT